MSIKRTVKHHISIIIFRKTKLFRIEKHPRYMVLINEKL